MLYVLSSVFCFYYVPPFVYVRVGISPLTAAVRNICRPVSKYVVAVATDSVFGAGVDYENIVKVLLYGSVDEGRLATCPNTVRRGELLNGRARNRFAPVF